MLFDKFYQMVFEEVIVGKSSVSCNGEFHVL